MEGPGVLLYDDHGLSVDAGALGFARTFAQAVDQLF